MIYLAISNYFLNQDLELRTTTIEDKPPSKENPKEKGSLFKPPTRTCRPGFKVGLLDKLPLEKVLQRFRTAYYTMCVCSEKLWTTPSLTSTSFELKSSEAEEMHPQILFKLKVTLCSRCTSP